MKSLGLAVALGLFCAWPAVAATTRLLVSIGNDIGDPEDVRLKYAALDAERVAQLFIELGGVSSDRAIVLANRDAESVRKRLAEVSGRIAELHAAGNDVVLLMYASGHARDGSLHLSGTHLPLAELRDFAAGTKARLRVLMVDSCDSGSIARFKGGKPGKGYDVSFERLPLTGQVVLTSSGSTEASEEWDSLGGSLFTHHLLSGLRGDADSENDGKVTLSEIYSYTYRRTLAGSASAEQHPAVDLDLAGTGELVLSEPSTAKSALTFAREASGHYLVSSQPRSDVVIEVDKREGQPLQLAVPAGRYLVRKRKGQSTGLLTVELPYGGRAAVDDKELQWKNFAEVALKGGYVELTPGAVMVSGAVVTQPIENSGPRWRLGLGYRHTFGEWWLGAGVTGSRAVFRGQGLTTTELGGAVQVSGGYRFVALRFVPYVGLGAEVLGLSQSFVRDDEAAIVAALGTSVPPRSTVGFGVGPVLAIELPIVSRLFAQLQVQGLIRYLPAEQQPLWSFGLNAGLALGVRL